MEHKGELIALVVAVSWTATAILAEIATKRLGTIVMNVLRMAMSIIMLSALMMVVTGSPVPQFTDAQVWLWLGLSGIVGYVFGDYCLFKSYLLIGSRFGQLFMTMSSIFASMAGYLLLAERISLWSAMGILVTLLGISISVFNRDSDSRSLHLKLSTEGVLYGIGASFGQGVGLVLSKMGMVAYDHCLTEASAPGAFFTIQPFAATFIRGLIGLIGFTMLLFMLGEVKGLRAGVHDSRALLFVFLATFFGPFFGVSLSLLAVSYTATGIAQTIMSITPILILLPAHYIFHQRITWLEVFGAAISIVGVSMLIG